jgi:ElaB/YqjD/DUF883 family membrane-anchored ribosome-binding protein
MEEAKAAARQAGEHVKSTASEMAEAGRETVSRLGAAWESTKNNIQEKAVTSARATDRVIRDHPYETIGIAFGVGVLIGVLINRK